MAKKLQLTKGLFALVDDDDYERVNRIKWYPCKGRRTKRGISYYVRRPWNSENRGKESLSRFIMNPPLNMSVDHINGEGLDNRKENLRIVTHRENSRNRHGKKTSKYPGVSWSKIHKKWRSDIQFKGKIRNLGQFNDENEAYTAYVVACEVLIGG